MVDAHRIPPASVTAGGQAYPDDIPGRLAEYAQVCRVPATRIASELGAPRAANVALLGAMSAHVPEFTAQQWRAAVAACVPPKHRDLNLAAFEKGREAKSE